ncbi:MAG: carboxypeptidase regulatory-like domain-containing protein [Acidobacteria bacterium]|nr:carboxypeptidase regulatory-like domain-containing protein [Acidobacteriota bacterium]
MTRDPGKPRDRKWLPYKGALPGAAPARQADGALQSAPGVNAPNATGTNFDGLAANGSAPPDSSGRVGPNHFVEWINTVFAIYDKAGTILYGPASGNTLFTSLGGACSAFNDGDPVVQYDGLADRWVLTQFVVGAPAPAFSHQCVAVSKTGDPLGAYYLYDFPTDATNFVDYPKWTTWTDAYYMTAHLFNAAGTAFLGAPLYAFDRGSMLAGLPAAFQSVNLDPTGNVFGHLVADLDGLTPPPPGSPAYVFAPASPEWDGTATPGLHFWTAASTWGGTPTLTVTPKADVATAAYNTNLCGFSRDCIPQSGTTQKLDSLTGQLMFRAAYRKVGATESVLVSHTVNALVPPANQAAFRWYEIRTPATTPTIFQQGTYAPTTANRWVSSIAMDEVGNIAAGYSISDATMFPSINITGRQTFDPLGTLGGEIAMFTGLGAQTGGLNRWGDYTQMSVDPRDGCSFWYINQYQPASGSFNWKTRIGSFRFPNCVAPVRGTITGLVKDAVGNPIANAVVQVDAGFSGATDATGRYTIVLPPGPYTATATDPAAGCTPSASQAATVTNGATTTRNFTLTGAASLVVKSTAIDDSSGNGNGVINRNECFKLDVDLTNVGCLGASGVSAAITTSTPGVEILVGSSSYPNIARATEAFGTTPFSLATTAAFVCGTDIAVTLTVTSSAGMQVSALTLPTCRPTVVVTRSVTTASPTEAGRTTRNGVPATCAGKACPGLTDGANPHYYDAYSVSNPSSTARCVTVTASTSCSGTSMVHPVAYATSFNPANLCTNFLGDYGSSPNPGSVTFSVTLPAGQPLVLVSQAVSATTAGFVNCAGITYNVTGFLDDSDGGRPVAAASGGGTICLGNSVGLTGSGGTSCVWTPATGLSNPNTCTPTASPTVTTAYSVVVSNANGCASAPSSPVTVTIGAPPAAPVITAPATVGAGSPNRVASVPAVGGATYAWSITNGTITSGQGTDQITFTAGTPGTLTLGVIVTVGTCASSPGSANVTVASAGSALQFYGVTPCRIVDTRNANGPLGGPALAASGSPDRLFTLTGTCGIPSGAAAVSANLAVVSPSAGGSLAIYRGDGAATGTSSISFNAGKTRADNAILQLALDGSGTVKVNNSAAGTVNFILDVNGYFQ